MNELLELLANRGTARGADAVLDAAVAEVGADERQGDSNGGAAAPRVIVQRDLHPLPPEPFDGPTLVNMDTSRPRGRRPWRTALTAGGLAAMLGVVSLGVSSLLGGGGANSPESAVRQLADAIENQDPLAAVDVLAPDEVGALHDSVDGISNRAKELQLVDDAGQPLAGVDFEVGDLQTDTEELAPGYAKVTMHGLLISAQAHREGVSELIRRVWTNDGEDVTQAVIDTRDIPADIGTFVVAVQRDGSWYVSPAYTALEYVRVVNELPAADYGSGRAALQQLGADTPETAVQDALTAWSTGDWDRLWQLVPPNEIPVYDYRAALDQALADTPGPSFSIDAFAASADVDGDRANVTVRANGVTEDGSQWSIDDRCYSITDPNEGAPFGSVCGTAGVLGGFTIGFAPMVNGEGGNDTPLHVTAVQRDGRWFVSPVGTVLDIVDSAIRGTTQDQIYAMFGLYGELPVEAAVTLGQPISGTASEAMSMHVYTLDAHADQRIVGTLTEEGVSDPNVSDYATAVLVQPDGTQTYDSWNLFEGPGITLPVDGQYRIVVYAPTDHAFTLTVYDANDAPPELMNREDTNGTAESCEQLPDGSTQCTSSSEGFGSSSSSGFGTSVAPGPLGSTTETSIATSATIATVP